MSRWHNYYLDNYPHFCTSTVADWRHLLRDRAISILYEEWDIARKSYAVKILAYVIMPNHYHVVLWSEQGKNICTFLRRSRGQVSKRMQRGPGFWKERPRVLPIYSETVLQAKVDYLHRNPLRKNLVANPEDWRHSSFRQIICGAQDIPFRCDDWEGVF